MGKRMLLYALVLGLVALASPALGGHDVHRDAWSQEAEHAVSGELITYQLQLTCEEDQNQRWYVLVLVRDPVEFDTAEDQRLHTFWRDPASRHVNYEPVADPVFVPGIDGFGVPYLMDHDDSALALFSLWSEFGYDSVIVNQMCASFAPVFVGEPGDPGKSH